MTSRALHAAADKSSAAAGVALRLDAQLVQRCADACAAIGLPPADVRIVVGCSGGADSAALLHLLRRVRPQAKLFACYVDHAVRPPEAIARDRAAVRAQARAVRAVIRVRTVDVVREAKSPEEAMRQARYGTLLAAAVSCRAPFVAVGHQQDDRVEGLLLALFRGSGLDGLVGMPARRRLSPEVDLVRPILWAPKQHLTTYAAAHRIPLSVDETNADLRFRRNAVRDMLSRVERLAAGSVGAAARCATLLAADQELLGALSERTRRACLWSRDSHALRVAALRRLRPALSRRVIRLAVKQQAPATQGFSFAQCCAVERAVLQKRGGSFAAGAGARVILSGGKLVVRSSEDRSRAIPQAVTFAVPERRGNVSSDWGRLVLRLSAAYAPDGRPGDHAGVMTLDAERLPPGTQMQLRNPKVGDSCIPSGRANRISLARFLAKEGVPKDMRATVPVLSAGDKIVAVLGTRTMEPFKARAGRPALEVRLETGR